MENERLLTSAEAARLLRLNPQTLAVWRCQRRSGPKYVRIGGRTIRYRREDIEAYLEGQRVEVVQG